MGGGHVLREIRPAAPSCTPHRPSRGLAIPFPQQPVGWAWRPSSTSEGQEERSHPKLAAITSRMGFHSTVGLPGQAVLGRPGPVLQGPFAHCIACPACTEAPWHHWSSVQTHLWAPPRHSPLLCLHCCFLGLECSPALPLSSGGSGANSLTPGTLCPSSAAKGLPGVCRGRGAELCPATTHEHLWEGGCARKATSSLQTSSIPDGLES